MKRFCSLFLTIAFLSVIFCGCSKIEGESPPDLPLNFKATAVMQYNNIQVSGDFTVKGFNYFSIDFTAPELLKPLKMVIENDECRLYYNNIEYQMNVNEFQSTAFGEQLAECIGALFDIQSLEINHQKSGDWLYSGKLKNGAEFKAVQDADSGFIKAVEIPKNNFYVVVTDFEIIE
ncbi:MAG: hypothetical protein K5917_02670 [Clostridiales bacterium]|nr:hypothetical protein [Clostridiales bacterium]